MKNEKCRMENGKMSETRNKAQGMADGKTGTVGRKNSRDESAEGCEGLAVENSASRACGGVGAGADLHRSVPATRFAGGLNMGLSMMQEMMIYDDNGKCRCPVCGRFRKREDFPDQPGHIEFGDATMRGHLHVAPSCRKCMEHDEPANNAVSGGGGADVH